MLKSPPDLMARKLEQASLLNQERQSDRLELSDARLLAALDGSQPLTRSEAALLQASALTLRRLRHLTLRQRANADAEANSNNDANRPPQAWQGSHGQLLAAASHATELDLQSSDRYWQMSFIWQAQTWQVLLRLNLAEVTAQTARTLMQQALKVCDGAGGIILRGQLDADAELEAAWPFVEPPLAHFLKHGASFSVLPESA